MTYLTAYGAIKFDIKSNYKSTLVRAPGAVAGAGRRIQWYRASGALRPGRIGLEAAAHTRLPGGTPR